MPTVPRVSGPEVGQQGLPNARIDVRYRPEDFGAGQLDGVAAAATRAAQERDRAAAVEKQKTDTAQVTAARNGLAQWENDWFDPNNQNGVRAYQGAAALGLQTAMAQDYKSRVETLSKGLGDPEQRRVFGVMAEQYGEQVRSRINNYAYAENHKYQAETFKASLATSTNTAATAARDGDMDRARREMLYAETLIDHNAKLTGEPPELVTQRKRDLLSQTNLAGVAGMVSAGRVQEAEDFWIANRENMDEKDRLAGAKSVVLGRIQADPQAMSYALSVSVPGPAGATVAGLPATPIAQIRSDAGAAGVPASTALAIAHMESGINPDAKNPRSSAAGMFQLLDSSREQYGGGDDLASQSKAGVAYIADSYKALRQGLGREPQPYEVYMAHLFGQAGAQTVLKAPDDARLADVVRKYDSRNADAIVNNNGMSGMTVGQAKEKWRGKMGQALAAVGKIPEDAPAVEDARKGELGTLHNPDGSVSTEISITVTDPDLNGGRATNIPLLVKGQQGVERLQAGDDPTDAQQRIAIERAIARVKGGASLPSFNSIADAEAAASERSDAKGRVLDDPVIAELPIENRIQLQSAAESQARQAQGQARADLQVKVQDSVAAFARGEQPVTGLVYADFEKAYGPTMAAREYQDYRGWQQFGSDVGQLKTMPAADMARYLEQRRPAAGGDGYADAAKRYDALAQAAAHVQKARQEDPIQAALAAGGTVVQPLNMANAQNLPDQLALRVAGAQQVSSTYGTPLQLFSKAETRQLIDRIDQMTAQEKVPFLRSLKAGITDPQAFDAAMAQIAPDKPVLGVAGKILQKQESIYEAGSFPTYTGTITKREDVAALMIKGDALLNPTAADKKEDGKAKPFPMPSGAEERTMREDFDDYAGAAFRSLPDGYQLTYQSARAYYAAVMADRGSYSGALDQAVWERAMKAATGGVTNYQGRGSVVLPYGMPEFQFDTSAQSAFERSLAVRGMKPDQLRNYGLQSLAEGRYIVTSGGSALLDPQGRKVTIDLNGGP